MRTYQDILDYVEDNDVKFVRLAFCDIFGTEKNIAIFSSELKRIFEEGVCFDGSSIPGFMNVEESDLVLWPDPATMTILPWRPTEGRVMRLFCDIARPGGQEFAGNCRGYLKSVEARFATLGLTCNVGTECEFYLTEIDDRGRPTKIPLDHGGYFDIAPLDKGENIRREICFAMEDMGLKPIHSHHESGFGQNEVDFMYASPLQACDNLFTFKSTVKAVANRSGLYASFMPKPFPDQPGSGLHVNISLYKDGKNLFEGDIAPKSIAGSFMAGIIQNARALTAFANPIPNSYARFGSCEAPKYVSWSRQNRSQLVRLPSVHGDSCRMELRSPDPSCNPYLAIGLILAAGLEGIERGLELDAPVNRNLFLESRCEGLEALPASLEEAIHCANDSEFVQRELPFELASKHFAQQSILCLDMKNATDPERFEREHYFNHL